MAFLNEIGLERLWTHILAKLGTKVDKVSGKGLSTNDYTNEDKDKLTSVVEDITTLNDLVGDTSVSDQIGAAILTKVDKTELKQSNWDQNDSSEIDYIQNRPFYKDNSVTPSQIIVDTTTFTGTSYTSAEGIVSYKATVPCIIAVSDTNPPESLKFIYDGEEYIVYKTGSTGALDALGNWFYGNPLLIAQEGYLPFFTEPFVAAFSYRDQSVTIHAETSGSHTIKIETEEVVNSTVVKLPLEFLPEHTHNTATTSAAGFMSASDKSKLNGIATGANKTVVDSALNSSSTNPVQNKVINAAISNLNTLVGDTSVSEQIAAANMIYVGPDEPTDSNIKVWINTTEEGAGVIPLLPRITTITLSASSWIGDATPYSQVVEVSSVTAASKVDLQPTASQIASLQNEEIALMAENTNGVITIYAFGGKPTSDMTIQVMLTEVSYV